MSQPIIQVKNLKKHFKQYKKPPGFVGSIKSLFSREYESVEAVNDINFEIDPGEFVGFIGPNGAGKTTTLKCLSGLLYPSGGEVSVAGYIPWERKREFLKQISLVMGQKNQLWWDLPAIDSFSLNQKIYEIPIEKYRSILDELIELLEVRDIVNVQVRKLSLGQRMRCELISSLLHRPKILFLDEPTIGLDVLMQKKLRAFFKDFNERYGTTVMLTSHYMEDVKELCKRIIVVNRGEVVFDGKIKELISNYIQTKIISVIFSKKIAKKDLLDLGEIIQFDGTSALLRVQRVEVPHISAAILKRLPVEDLEIREVGLDEVVGGIFGG